MCRRSALRSFSFADMCLSGVLFRIFGLWREGRDMCRVSDARDTLHFFRRILIFCFPFPFLFRLELISYTDGEVAIRFILVVTFPDSVIGLVASGRPDRLRTGPRPPCPWPSVPFTRAVALTRTSEWGRWWWPTAAVPVGESRAVSARPQATAAPSRTGLRPRPGVRSAAPDPFPRCPQCRSLRHCPPAEVSDPVRQGLSPAALSPSDGSHSAGPSGLPRLLTDWLHVGGSHDALRVESSAGTLTELGETLSLLSQCVTPDTPQRQTVGRAQDQAWGGGGASTPSRGTCRLPGTPEPVVRGSTALVAPGLGRG